jgi:hypothetical protein
MSKPDAGFNYDRYRKLLAEATDEPKRLALIDLLVDEKAKDSLALESLRIRLADLGLTGSGEAPDRLAEKLSGSAAQPAAARVSSWPRLPLQRCRADRWSG